MNCKLYRDLLSLYVGGDLERDEEIAVRAHVGMCAECAREVEDYRSAIGSLRDAKPTEQGPSLWAGVAASIAPNAAEERPTREMKRPSNEIAFAWIACAAALLMGLGVGLVVERVWDREPPKSPAPAVGTADVKRPDPREKTVADVPGPNVGEQKVGTGNPGLINDFLDFLVGDASPRKRRAEKGVQNAEGSFHLQPVEPVPASRHVRF